MVEDMKELGMEVGKTRFLKILIDGPLYIPHLKDILSASEKGKLGIEELEGVFNYFDDPQSFNIEFDASLARGLDYYTGIIMEVKAEDVSFGSVGGGGRYDDLTGVFGLPDVTGVGVSFGLDRIYDVMESNHLFPDLLHKGSRILFTNFGNESEKTAFKYLTRLRNEGISGEIYPNNAKMKKQMKFADSMQVPFVGIIGADEEISGKIALRNMASGEQIEVTYEEMLEILQKG